MPFASTAAAGSGYAGVICRGCKSTTECAVEVGLDVDYGRVPSPTECTCDCNYTLTYCMCNNIPNLVM
jgi:hypothetical protein